MIRRYAILLLCLLLYPASLVLAADGDGTLFMLEFASTGKPSVDRELNRRTLEQLRKRIVAADEAGTEVEQTGQRRIELRTIRQGQEAEELVQQLAKQSRLEFRLVDESATPGKPAPAGSETLYEVTLSPSGSDIQRHPVVVRKKALLSGDIVASAAVSIDPQFQQPFVALTFNSEGARQFADVTRRMVGKRLAIVLDGNVLSVPVIREAVTGGQVQISGQFTTDSAGDIASALNTNFLPVTLRVVTRRVAPATDLAARAHRQQISKAEADLARLKAEAEEFTRHADRLEQLARANAVPQQEVEEARTLRPLIAAKILEAEQRLERLRAVPAPAASPSAVSPGAPQPAAPAAPATPPRLAGPDDDAIAIVIGIEKYQSLPSAEYVHNDAVSIREYLRSMGYQDRNIEFLADERATYSGILKAVESWLPNRVTSRSRVTVYFAGHGAPDPQSGEAYLVPYDGDPAYLKVTGYPLKRLYERLESLPARQTVVFIDACFSGAGGRSVLARGARALVRMKRTAPKGSRIAVLSSTRGAQISSSFPEKKQGIFTFFLLQAFQQGHRDMAAVFDYLKPRVEDQAKRMNVEQSPQLDPEAATVRGKFLLW